MQVITKEIKISMGEPVTLIPMSDIHAGDIGFDKEKLQQNIDWVRTHNAYVILLGDQIAAITGADKRFENTSIHPDYRDKLDNLPYEQTDAVRKMFEPIKDRVLAAMGGNHETKILKAYSFDSTDIFTKALDTPRMMDPSIFRLKFRRTKTSVFTVDLFCTHGVGLGGGRLMGGTVNNMRALANSFQADIYLAGHTHKLFVIEDNYLVPNQRGAMDERKRIFINTGTYQGTYNSPDDVDTWGSRSTFSPPKLGSARIDFYLKKKGGNHYIDTHARV
jgi:predicted phosphodiesterase